MPSRTPATPSPLPPALREIACTPTPCPHSPWRESVRSMSRCSLVGECRAALRDPVEVGFGLAEDGLVGEAAHERAVRTGSFVADEGDVAAIFRFLALE